jgi:hypothetical protein
MQFVVKETLWLVKLHNTVVMCHIELNWRYGNKESIGKICDVFWMAKLHFQALAKHNICSLFTLFAELGAILFFHLFLN